MKVNVTQKHIDDGEQGSGLYCPIANAANEKARQLYPNDMTQVLVNRDSFELRIHNKDTVLYDLPFAAREFVENFDKLESADLRRRMIKPFAFEARRAY